MFKYISVCDKPVQKMFNYYDLSPDDLCEFSVKLNFSIDKPCVIHGISSWFDTVFKGSESSTTLSTSPFSPPTHWYQIKLLLKDPIAVNKGQTVNGTITFKAHKLQSYFIHLKLGIKEIDLFVENIYDLKEPDFRGYTTGSTLNYNKANK
jgi:histone-arginine methyltransferase CARM1